VGGLSLTLLSWKWGVWAVLSLTLAALFILLIFIRITVPRLKLESLSRLGWGAWLGLLAGVGLVYALGLLLG